MQIPPILRLVSMEYFYQKLSETTMYNYSKQAVMRASEYIETVHRDVRIFICNKRKVVFSFAILMMYNH